MSLGKPNLYLAGALVAGDKTSAVTTLAGLKINWGNDSRVDFAGPATLSAEIIIRSGPVPSWANGTQVGVTDPLSGRCLFAGHISNLRAAPDPSIKSALRIQFTATSPLADLSHHSLYDFNWPAYTNQNHRFNQLSTSIARGWIMVGPYKGDPFAWINAGRIKFQEKSWLDLLAMWCRSVRGRYHDTSTYTPGGGFTKRISITAEREKTAPNPPGAGVTTGAWYSGSKPAAATGIAALPARVIGRDVEWEKNPDDTITDVQLTSFGGVHSEIAADDPEWESAGFAIWMDAAGVNNQAMQDAYGFRQLQLDTDIGLDNVAATDGWVGDIANFWLDADTKWRPTGIEIPDGHAVDTAALLNLLAVDTRHMACLYVPQPAGIVPGKIHAYVTAGKATWTGKKWTAELTLGRTFD